MFLSFLMVLQKCLKEQFQVFQYRIYSFFFVDTCLMKRILINVKHTCDNNIKQQTDVSASMEETYKDCFVCAITFTFFFLILLLLKIVIHMNVMNDHHVLRKNQLRYLKSQFLYFWPTK